MYNYKEVMSDELRRFVTWLRSDLSSFVAIVEEGSVVAGDPWQEGFSDHDLNIIVKTDIKPAMHTVYSYLADHPLGDDYLVGLRLAHEFAVGDSLNDLSLKFRAATLAGTDVVATKAPPTQDKALEISQYGLENLLQRLERRWLNLSQWTTRYTQRKNYEIFKYFFVFVAAFRYGKTGTYPVSRLDAAKTFADLKEVSTILEVCNNIGHASKQRQRQAIECAIVLIDNLLKGEDPQKIPRS